MPSRMTRNRSIVRHSVMAALLASVPLSMGGCPDLQNQTIDALAGATTAIVVGDEDPQAAAATASTGILTAAIDFFFDQFRTDQ